MAALSRDLLVQPMLDFATAAKVWFGEAASQRKLTQSMAGMGRSA
jgi:hypothetical protein